MKTALITGVTGQDGAPKVKLWEATADMREGLARSYQEFLNKCDEADASHLPSQANR